MVAGGDGVDGGGGAQPLLLVGVERREICRHQFGSPGKLILGHGSLLFWGVGSLGRDHPLGLPGICGSSGDSPLLDAALATASLFGVVCGCGGGLCLSQPLAQSPTTPRRNRAETWAQATHPRIDTLAPCAFGGSSSLSRESLLPPIFRLQLLTALIAPSPPAPA
jgi:hypothetical protein